MTDHVPDDVDLDAMKHARSTTDDADRKRCPECGVAAIAPQGRSDIAPDNDGPYCRHCCTHVTPVTGTAAEVVDDA